MSSGKVNAEARGSLSNPSARRVDTYRDTGQENENYRDHRGLKGVYSSISVYWGCIGIQENRMETIIYNKNCFLKPFR